MEEITRVQLAGLILPILANNNEQKSELEEHTANGKLRTAIIAGGPEISSLGTDLQDHSSKQVHLIGS